MKDEFVSMVSHELRTPLTSIHGSLRMLSSGLLQTDTERGKRLLQIASDSTDRLVRLINDILDLERIESGKVSLVKRTWNIADLITEAVDGMQAIADKAGITLTVVTIEVEVLVDRDRIIQTLTNLLSNAIKFSPKGSIVQIQVKQQTQSAITMTKIGQQRAYAINAALADNCFETMNKLNNKYQVYICTTYIWSEIVKDCGDILKYKYDFLYKELPFINPNKYIFATNKKLINCDVKIDDKLENLEGASIKLLFTAYHNKNLSDDYLRELGVIRVNNWIDVNNILLKDN
jgi:5'(3')-deoxyribonucleotidase